MAIMNTLNLCSFDLCRAVILEIQSAGKYIDPCKVMPVITIQDCNRYLDGDWSVVEDIIERIYIR